MDNNKTPGPDRLLLAFYKGFRDSTLSIVLETFKDAFKADIFSAKLAKRQIIILFKKDDSIVIKNYRPITLLNIDYKIIIKALAKRFFRVLSEVVSKCQFTFIPERRVSDYIIVLNLILKLFQIQI